MEFAILCNAVLFIENVCACMPVLNVNMCLVACVIYIHKIRLSNWFLVAQRLYLAAVHWYS